MQYLWNSKSFRFSLGWSSYAQRTLIDDSWKCFAKLTLLWTKRSTPKLQIPWKKELNRKPSFLWSMILSPHATIELTVVACNTASAIACLIICSKEATLNFFHFVKSLGNCIDSYWIWDDFYSVKLVWS